MPPGNWDRNVLLPILIAQSRAIALRRKMAKAGKCTTSPVKSTVLCTSTPTGNLVLNTLPIKMVNFITYM